MSPIRRLSATWRTRICGSSSSDGWLRLAKVGGRMGRERGTPPELAWPMHSPMHSPGWSPGWSTHVSTHVSTLWSGRGGGDFENPGKLWGCRNFSGRLNSALTRSSPISLFSERDGGRRLPATCAVFRGRIVGIVPVAARKRSRTSAGFVGEAWPAGHFCLARCKIVETPVGRN